MTSLFLVADLSTDEGLSLSAYPDFRSPLAAQMRLPLAERVPNWKGLSGAPWTCGYGCTGRDIHAGTQWTKAEAAARRDQKINEAQADLDAHMPWWRTLNGPRQDVLVMMVYNMGILRLETFEHALAAMQAGDFERAADEMLDSWWHRELPKRSERLAKQMRLGKRVAP